MHRLGFLSLILTGLLAACIPQQAQPKRYDLIVENQCKGADQTVYLYINGEYRGTVRGSRLFPGFPEGSYELKAVGTLAGAKTFTRSLKLDQDTIWTLCI